MAVRDIEAFVRERAVLFDPNLDVTSGSPFDKQVIQPLVRRLGTDPFTVDMETFIVSRLNQAFPDMATSEGDGITDLLVSPAQLLWDPIVREISRMGKGLSFRDPNTLTNEEAEALGANLFAERPKGEYARGVGRIFFAQAQNITISPVNFFTSKSGLVFPPTETQSIRLEEMLLNDNGDGTYYFDVNLIAEQPGSDYNIGPDDLSAVASLDAAVRVTNLRRFKEGQDAATAAEFVDDVKQQLTERSMVTLRGIAAKVTNAFPEVSRLNTIGYNDPEMQRDVLTGGGLGPILTGGVKGSTVADSLLNAGTTRFVVADVNVDFTQSIGPIGEVSGQYILTVLGAFTTTLASDLHVVRVISANTLEIREPVMVVGRSNLGWTLRRRELTLSGIPGGLLFPNNADGTVTIPDGEVHVGGAVDIHVRGSSADESSLIVDAIADDEPELEGTTLTFDLVSTTVCTLSDSNLVLGTGYIFGDETYMILANAAIDGASLQVLDGANAGTYRVLRVVQADGQNPVLSISPAFPTLSTTAARWKLFYTIDVNLTDIKDTRITAGDLITAQNSNIVKTSGGTDFDALGVSKGDVLRILSGDDVGDYTITEAPLVPTFQQLKIDAKLKASIGNVRYTVFRPNAAGNMQVPLLRVKQVNLLDGSNQPLGTTIPYARPVDVQSRAFQNPARGVKLSTLMQLGLLSRGLSGSGTFTAIGGTSLKLRVGTPEVGVQNIVVSFPASPANKTPAQVAAEINADVLTATGEAGVAVVITYGGLTYVGIRPFGPLGYVESLPSGTASSSFFGDLGSHTTNDMRQLSVTSETDWRDSSTGIDFSSGLDVFQVRTGNQVGPVHGPYAVGNKPTGEASYTANVGVLPADRKHPFAPEVGVLVDVGARSLGSVRMYFLEPTSTEVRANETYFSLVTATGVLRYTPDPTLSYQRIPALPSGGKPHDGSIVGNLLQSSSQDFVNSGVRPGDFVIVDFRTVGGTLVLPDPVPNLVNKTFQFSLDGSAPKTLIFIRDDVSLAPTEVSRASVAAQINAAAGVTLVRLRPDNHLSFDVEVALTIFKAGTANALILGNDEDTGQSFSTFDVTNDSPAKSPNASGYVVESVNPGGTGADRLTVTVNFAGPGSLVNQQFRILRAGVQRVSTSQMKAQVAEAGLYYADVELVSEGVGDVYNIDSGVQLAVTGDRTDGYYLTTEDPNLTFSPVERPHLVITKSILEDGVDDDPVNATQLLGQNIQIVFERSSLVDNVNTFSLSETERVVCASPLARHLIPHYVRFDVNYVGGSSEEVTVPELEDYINNLSPVEALESSDVQGILSGKGATSIDNPISLIAMVHGVDRTITAHRSQNRLYTGRLAAFIPDLLNVVRRVS